MPSDQTGLHLIPTHQDLRRRIDAKLKRLIVPPTPKLSDAQVSDLCLVIMHLDHLASERPGVMLDFTPGKHALCYWTALHFIDEISWMRFTIHQTTLEARRQEITEMSAQLEAFGVALDAFVGCHPDDWPPADFVSWEPPVDTLHHPFWAAPPRGKPQTIALHLLPMVPSHAELRERVRRKMQGWAPAKTAPMPEHTLNQVCLTISMLSCESTEQHMIEKATSVSRFTNQQAMLTWCAEVFIEEIDLVSHAGIQVVSQARQRGVTDEQTLEALQNTALQEFIGSEAQWRKGYHDHSSASS